MVQKISTKSSITILLLSLSSFSLTSAVITFPSFCSTLTSTTLRPGVTSPKVQELQRLLNQDPSTQVSTIGAGSPGKETTKYGLATRAAVKRFQEKYKDDILIPNGLTKGTGLFGPSTKKKLYALYCTGIVPPPTPIPVPIPTPTPVPPTPQPTPTPTPTPQPTPINGSCGSSHGGSFTSAPTTNLCTTGTPTSVTTNSSTYTWSCTGSGGGSTASCSANKMVITATTSASGIPTRTAFSNYPVVGRINAKSGDIIENVHIVSNTGPCIYITNNVTNVIIRNSEIGPCKDANGNYREGVSSVDGSTNIVVRQNVIHDVNTGLSFYKSIHPIYIDHNNFYNIQGPFPQGKSVGFNLVTAGTSGSKIMCNLSDMQGMVYPTTRPWGVEDHISMWLSNGLFTNKTEIAYNRIRGGISKSGSAMQIADGGGGNAWSHDNTVVNVGGGGIGIASGENSVIENNRIFSDPMTNPASAVGIYVKNYYASTSACRNNTIKNNKVFTYNNAWLSAGSIENYGTDHSCDEGLVVIGNSFSATNTATWYKSPGDPTLNATIFDEEYSTQCSSPSSFPSIKSSPSPSGAITLTATSCTIPTDGSVCTIPISWSISNPSTPSIRQGSTQFSTSATGSSVPRSLSYGTTTFTLSDGTLTLDTKTATASCVSGTSWNGTTCASPAPSPLATLSTLLTTPSATQSLYGTTTTCKLGFKPSALVPITNPTPIPSSGGTFFTGAQESLWRTRSLAPAPFITNNDYMTGSPGDWTRIKTNASAFLKTPDSPVPSSEGATRANYGINPRDAAFFYLMTASSSYVAPLRDYLVGAAQATQNDFTSLCFREFSTSVTADAYFMQAGWFARYISTYDFVRRNLSATDRLIIENYIRKQAYFFAAHTDWGIGGYPPSEIGLFPNRLSGDYSIRGREASSTNSWEKWVYARQDTNGDGVIDTKDATTTFKLFAYTKSDGTLGPQLAVTSLYFNNRRSVQVYAFGMAGILLGDKELINRSKRYYMEWLTWGVYPDGSQGEYVRNGDYAIPSQGIIYSFSNTQTAALMAHWLAIQGDRDLVDFSTMDGDYGTQTNNPTLAKTIAKEIKVYFDLRNKVLPWHYAEMWKPVQEPRDATHLGVWEIRGSIFGDFDIFHELGFLMVAPTFPNVPTKGNIMRDPAYTSLRFPGATGKRVDTGNGSYWNDVGRIYPAIFLLRP